MAEYCQYCGYRRSGVWLDVPSLQEHEESCKHNPKNMKAVAQRKQLATYTTGFLKHAVATPSQYDSTCRDLASLVLSEREKVATLKEAINIDRTGLAAALVDIRKIVRGWAWIAAGEWGSYEWQDRTVETLQREVGQAFGEIREIIERSLNASGKLATAAVRGDPLPVEIKKEGA
jgi:hypothetical protein